uniref:Putative NDBP n=1 Tax=Superstitionia donensis TaxID=311983 RepID=A0A1V1WBK9_9SCOR
MKTQFLVLIVALVFTQIFSEAEAAGFWGKLWEGVKSVGKSLLGKRGLRNVDQFDDLYEPDLSPADLKFLQELLR